MGSQTIASPRRVVAALGVVVLLPGTVLTGLGWQAVVQERRMRAARTHEAASQTVEVISRRLSEEHQALRELLAAEATAWEQAEEKTALEEAIDRLASDAARGSD
ncbi:hypothetical protein ACFL59_06505 [Planctomycetota bacterium]